LKSCARHSDTVARLGGDEFGFLLSPMEMRGGLDAMLQRITAAIEPPVEFEQQVYPLKASIGAAEVPDDGKNLENLLEVADQRMYRMKRDRYIGMESPGLQ
jgi:diguanylate cyclase (GGDEF)-like protein